MFLTTKSILRVLGMGSMAGAAPAAESGEMISTHWISNGTRYLYQAYAQLPSMTQVMSQLRECGINATTNAATSATNAVADFDLIESWTGCMSGVMREMAFFWRGTGDMPHITEEECVEQLVQRGVELQQSIETCSSWGVTLTALVGGGMLGMVGIAALTYCAHYRYCRPSTPAPQPGAAGLPL